MIALTGDASAFVTDRHLAILSTSGRDGRIHSVPIGFTVEDGVARIICSDATQKVRNIERDGHATIAQVDGIRWITLVGSARIDRDPDAVAHAVELYAARYRQPSENPTRVVIAITIDKVLGSRGMK